MQHQTVQQRTSTDRLVLAEVSKWAHQRGWYHDGLGWVDANLTTRVRETDNGTGIDLWRRTSFGNWQMFPTFIPAVSVRQGLDLLVALDILPAQFARAYEAGVESCQPTIRRLVDTAISGGAR